jgi:hypothetical protein
LGDTLVPAKRVTQRRREVNVSKKDRLRGGSSSTKKVDVPFRDDGEIAEMVEQFEAGTWPHERWTHRAHLAVAISYLRQYAFEEAVARARRNIQEYNRIQGEAKGYHETITLLFMRRVRSWLEREGAGEMGIARIVEELFLVLDMRWPLAYYSEERLWSAEARREWVEPDLRGLDF